VSIEEILPAAESHAPASVPARRSVAYLAGVLAGGNLLSSLLRLIGGVWQARLVGPSVLGLFNSIGLVMGYAPFLQLGILNGLNRELPYYFGKGDHQRVKELAAAAQAWALMIGSAVSTTLLAIAGWQLVCGEWPLAAGWATYAIMAFLFFYSTSYLQMTYRTSQDFARLAVVGVIESSVALILVLLVALLNFYGVCLRALLAGTVSMMILHYFRPVRVGPKWDWRHLKHLLIIGAPIFGVGQLYTWWAVLDSTLVLHFTGTEGMGLYAVVLVAAATMELLPGAMLQIMYPRMAQQYGRTENVRDLIRMTVKPMLLGAAGMIPLILVAWLLVGPAVRLVLPNYVEAIPAMQWALLIPLTSCFGQVNHVFNVVRRQGLYVIAILCGMGCYLGSLAWLLNDGVSLVAFPQAMLAGRVVYILLCHGLVIRLVHQVKQQ
jgi:O-antigen/teichoic acid export membrane protein